MSREKIVVGMSGGVDSSVAAFLLREQGYEVLGVNMEVTPESQAAEDAARAAAQLGIPLYTADFREVFRERVVSYFVQAYQNGETPNPCVLCNPQVKWAALLQKAGELGASLVATGHYARVVRLPSGRFSLRQAASRQKDQTYALCGLTQEQLSRTVMPLGEYTKEEVRGIAGRIGLDAADKPDSQEICFIPDGDYASYIERYTGEAAKPGAYVDAAGRKLGEHRGIIRYTVGQRKGLGLSLGHPVFVTRLCPEKNQVVIGEEQELMASLVRADRVNYMALPSLREPVRVTAKIRYNHRGESALAYTDGEGRLTCRFDRPVRAATPGQSLVLYTEDGCVAAGGIIIGADS